MITSLYLIRHGESHANVNPAGPIPGMRGDAGLTALGRQQAERLRDRLAQTHEIAADVVLASTLPRARQTAEIVAPALDQPIVWDDEIQELRPGEADGIPLVELRRRYGLSSMREQPLTALAPGGENWPQFVLRVATALDRIAREHEGKTVVLFTHGGFIDTSFVVFFQMSGLIVPPTEFYTHNTSLTLWERHSGTGESGRWRLVRYNDEAHVRDIVVDERFRWRKLEQDLRGAQEPAEPVPTEEHTRE